MIPRLDRLIDAVQANCHIADARHAQDLTLCTYLLEMRELYRWEQGIAFSDEPPRADVGRWLAEREALWESVEDADFRPLPIHDRNVEPFAADAINDLLGPHGLVYGAGVGRFGKPQFFLGQLKRNEYRDGARILVAGCEYARDLAAPPAGLLGATVFIREEALKRWLWEKFETWRLKRPDGAFKATLAAYGFDTGPHAALDRMTAAESETLILHELGEFEAGKLLGDDWSDMCAGFTHRRAELLARATRDNLADCLVTLPTLMERDANASIHFWFSNFDGWRRELFPSLAGAYAAWQEGDGGHALKDAVAAGHQHWQRICEGAVAIHRGSESDAQTAIERLFMTAGALL